MKLAARAWAVGMDTAQTGETEEGEETEKRDLDPEKILKENLKTGHVEAAVLLRNGPSTSRFRLLDEKEVRAAIRDL